MTSPLTQAAQRLLTAEQTYEAVQSYWDNLPADQDYDLGVCIDWAWGGSTTGYKEVRHAVSKDLRRNLRGAIQASVLNAASELSEARKALVEAANA